MCRKQITQYMDKQDKIKSNNDAIRNCIKKHNITLTDIAKASGISKAGVGHWFDGDMSLSRAILIADYIGVSLDELTGRESKVDESEVITFHGKHYRITPLD